MRGLDTNVLVRYLTQDDAPQARKANALIDGAAAREERLHVEALVLCELVWVLRGAYRLNRPTIVKALEVVLDAGQFVIDDRDLLREALENYRMKRGDFADYVLGLRSREAGCNRTATFDRTLKDSELFTVL
jgi:predicted nucleic-acid-binding protein